MTSGPVAGNPQRPLRGSSGGSGTVLTTVARAARYIRRRSTRRDPVALSS